MNRLYKIRGRIQRWDSATQEEECGLSLDVHVNGINTVNSEQTILDQPNFSEYT